MPSDPTTVPTLAAADVSLGYGGPTIVEHFSSEIPRGGITAVIGANGCGKSTLLRALSRLMKPLGGTVLLDGSDIHSYPTRDVAKRLGLLPQGPRAPDGVTVHDLARRGRYPHQKLFEQWSADDQRAVDRAIELTGMDEFRRVPVDELSGGQRQRAWIAMALAQDTSLMLLDEPTTYLDIAHQVDVLELLAELNRDEGRTIVMVLHDLNQACRYASHVIAMRDGEQVAAGDPRALITAELVQEVFGVEVVITADPVTGSPLCVPVGRSGSTARSASVG